MAQKIRLDLHTHSSISYDGGILAAQYRAWLEHDSDLVIAISDHNEVSLALELHQEFGSRVIVAEEILSTEGEIIGLYLESRVTPGLFAQQTIMEIKNQKGLVYIPHPFEKTRKGVGLETLQKCAASIDIIEVFNARSKEPWLAQKAHQFAVAHNLALASSSDAHGIRGTGTAYSILGDIPTKETLANLLRTAELEKRHAPFLSLFDPLRNKIKKALL